LNFVPTAEELRLNHAKIKTRLVKKAWHIKAQEAAMNWDRIQADWDHLKKEVTGQWEEITDGEVDQIAGQRDKLVGNIERTYGIVKEEAEKQVTAWEESKGRDEPVP
jgi:uncharacterized protein YjbJ (UPF0337 family)